MADLEKQEPKEPESGPQPAPAPKQRLSFKQRLEHFTWANFTATQSTGGIAILLSETPKQFYGQQTAGTVIFIFNLVVFLLFCATMITRFILYPHKLKKSLTTAPEQFFVGSSYLTFATIIICLDRFGVPHVGKWLVTTVRVLFWIHAATTLLFSTTMFVVVFSNKKHINPLRLSGAAYLLIFPVMLTGTIASTIAESQPEAYRLPIIVAGLTYQGLGWTVSMMLLPLFIGSLFNNGLGAPSMRPSNFMPVGSAGYTIVALIGCARHLPTARNAYFTTHPGAIEVLQVVALWASIFIWLVGFWLSAMAILACLPNVVPRLQGGRLKPRMGFMLSWWAIIFPNVGFTIGTGLIGEELQSQGIQWVATAMTIILFVLWLMDMALHLKAVLTKQIMWPGKDEDTPPK